MLGLLVTHDSWAAAQGRDRMKERDGSNVHLQLMFPYFKHEMKKNEGISGGGRATKKTIPVRENKTVTYGHVKCCARKRGDVEIRRHREKQGCHLRIGADPGA